MSHLLVVTRPDLVTGFRLAGVDALAAEDAERAQALVGDWLDAGEEGLMAIDEGLLAHMEPAFLKRLQSSKHLLYLAIPDGQPLSSGASQQQRIAEMIRRAIGFHITFRREVAEGNEV
jgi:V/A-type H+-transporting ATPase subunit F